MTIQDPLHPEEMAAAYADVMVRNEARTRERLAAANRAADIALPKVGDTFFVTAARGLARRRRGGVAFGVKARKVEVVGVSDEELAKRQLGEEGVVSVYGAEQIFADTSLVIGGRLDPSTAELATENAELRAEAEKLRVELAAARRGAGPDPGDGSSSRLKAAAKVRDGGGGEFGSSGK